MKKISLDELRRMTDREGLILQGCGGNLDEWAEGINSMLTKEGILLGDSTFTDVAVFEQDGRTNLLFSMDGVDLHIGKLAMWKLKTNETFGGYWLSDWLENRMGVRENQREGANSMFIINAKRNGYSPDQCGQTMTVGALIRELECFEPDQPVYLSHDNGYTYGSVTADDFEEQEVESEDEALDEDQDLTMR